MNPLLERCWDALRSVIDPELALDIVTLGLVYDITFAEGRVTVMHTLTTPGCPMQHVISDGIRGALGRIPSIHTVDLILVWDPGWHPGMIAPGAL